MASEGLSALRVDVDSLMEVCNGGDAGDDFRFSEDDDSKYERENSLVDKYCIHSTITS
jgi:hypothetical protein